MSAFLGPIHHWLFKKIKFQDTLTSTIIKFYKNKGTTIDLANNLKEKFGVLEQQPLEDIINGMNIHGWLQERVSLVEYRFAYCVLTVLENKENTLSQLEDLFFEFGKQNKPSETDNAEVIFKHITDFLLDGMPCDRANEIVAQSNEEVTFRRTVCVHTDYWQELGGDISIYYVLRDCLINGMLDGSDFEYKKLDENTRSISLKK